MDKEIILASHFQKGLMMARDMDTIEPHPAAVTATRRGLLTSEMPPSHMYHRQVGVKFNLEERAKSNALHWGRGQSKPRWGLGPGSVAAKLTRKSSIHLAHTSPSNLHRVVVSQKKLVRNAARLQSQKATEAREITEARHTRVVPTVSVAAAAIRSSNAAVDKAQKKTAIIEALQKVRSLGLWLKELRPDTSPSRARSANRSPPFTSTSASSSASAAAAASVSASAAEEQQKEKQKHTPRVKSTSKSKSKLKPRHGPKSEEGVSTACELQQSPAQIADKSPLHMSTLSIAGECVFEGKSDLQSTLNTLPQSNSSKRREELIPQEERKVSSNAGTSNEAADDERRDSLDTRFGLGTVIPRKESVVQTFDNVAKFLNELIQLPEQTSPRSVKKEATNVKQSDASTTQQPSSYYSRLSEGSLTDEDFMNNEMETTNYEPACACGTGLAFRRQDSVGSTNKKGPGFDLLKP